MHVRVQNKFLSVELFYND